MARFVSEKEAAEYIGVDTSLVRAWVACGRLPQPIPDCGKFDLRAIDVALDLLSGIGTPTNSLDAWRAKKRAS